MLNYVAINISEYFIYGPWKDHELGFSLHGKFPGCCEALGQGNTRIHAGIFIALAAAMILQVILKRSKWGYEIRVIDENPGRHATGYGYRKKYPSRNIHRRSHSRLAGMGEIAGLHGRMSRGFTMGYGYTGITVAWLQAFQYMSRLSRFSWGSCLLRDTLQVVMGLPWQASRSFRGLSFFQCLRLRPFQDSG